MAQLGALTADHDTKAMSTGFDPISDAERFSAPRRGPALTTVLVVDDDVLERAHTRALLEEQEGMVLVGDCDTGSAVDAVTRLAPEVVLLDADLRGPAGRRGLIAVLTASARARVIVLTALGDPAALFEALVVGASGYLLKTQAAARLPTAIQQVMDGRVPVDPDMVALMRERLARPAPYEPQKQAGVEQPLTRRELTVLRHVAAGLTNEQIAAELVLSPGTVKLHVQHIIAKLGVANRTQAAVHAAQSGLLDT